MVTSYISGPDTVHFDKDVTGRKAFKKGTTQFAFAPLSHFRNFSTAIHLRHYRSSGWLRLIGFPFPSPTDNYAVKFIHKLQKLGSEEINGAIEETIIIKFWAAPAAFKLDSFDEYGGEREKGAQTNQKWI